MKHSLWWTSAVAALLTFSLSSTAIAHDGPQDDTPTERFGTISALGQNREHEKVTRAALHCDEKKATADYNCMRPVTLDIFAGARATFGAVGNPDNPVSRWTSHTPSHCDDMDYLKTYKDAKKYKTHSTAALKECVKHMWDNFDKAVGEAGKLASKEGALVEKEMQPTIVSGRVGTPLLGKLDCTFAGNPTTIAKCNALAALGAAAHADQDFYSHSNWSDDAGGTTVKDPPALKKAEIPGFLDFGKGNRSSINVPEEFSGGCFDEQEKWFLPDFSNHCEKDTTGGDPKDGRVTHKMMNKDEGDIDPKTGAATKPTTDRGKKGNNFKNAVNWAIQNTKVNWAAFIKKVQDQYPGKRGKVIACAMSYDEPKDCAKIS